MDFDLTVFDNIDSCSGIEPAIEGNLQITSPDFDLINNQTENLETTVDLNHDTPSTSYGTEIPSFDDWHSTTHGTPVVDSLVWHQQTTDFTCGIVSSEMILKMFGLDISESQLVYEATSQGFLTDNGMSIEGIQNILEKHGVDTHVGHGDINDLKQELDAGHKIIIPVDSGEIWGTDSRWEDWLGERADHAVVITGIVGDTVYLNDPGHPDGQAMEVSLYKFKDAWNDSGNKYLATDDAPLV